MPVIAVLNPDARPRERLLSMGAQALSDAELLAIILGSGLSGTNVLDLSQSLLTEGGGLAGLTRASLDELCRLRGIGVARGAAVLAALEIGRRAVGERPARGQPIRSAADIAAHLRARLGSCAVEEFWAVALDVRHRVVWEMCLARGSLTGVEVHPRDALRPLIRGGAAAVIFCHNHPSGDPSPSRQDLELTLRLRDVGELCGIAVLDHVIVGTDGFTSLAADYWTSGRQILQSPP
jgi:DNA repair protein RadC